jgi:hypothetical protein
MFAVKWGMIRLGYYIQSTCIFTKMTLIIEFDQKLNKHCANGWVKYFCCRNLLKPKQVSMIISDCNMRMYKLCFGSFFPISGLVNVVVMTYILS